MVFIYSLYWKHNFCRRLSSIHEKCLMSFCFTLFHLSIGHMNLWQKNTGLNLLEAHISNWWAAINSDQFLSNLSIHIWEDCASSRIPLRNLLFLSSKCSHSASSGELNFYPIFIPSFAFIRSWVVHHFKLKFGNRRCPKKSEYFFYFWL